jgi:predicted dehydrogenase
MKRLYHAACRERHMHAAEAGIVAQSGFRVQCPAITVTRDYGDILRKPDIDAVIVSTPASSHYGIVKAALEHDKDVLCEKPLALDVAEAQELVELAAARGKLLMVGHTFLFNVGIRKLKEYVAGGHLGQVHYLHFVRTNLGPIRKDASVVWDLAPHDLSIMDFLIQEKPEAVVATGEAHLNGLVDIAFITIYFPRNTIAHLNVNWLSPVKVRTTLIGGEKKMLVWNDLEADEKIKVYDKGVQINNGQGRYELLVSYRAGDMWAPRVEQSEALKVELDHLTKSFRV